MSKELRQRVARNLVVLRKSANLSQNTLASKISIGRSTYCQYEQGERLPDVETLYALCNFYRIHMDTLINQNVQAVLQEYFLYQEYTHEEMKLLKLYHSLSNFSKGRLIEKAEDLAQADQRRRLVSHLMK